MIKLVTFTNLFLISFAICPFASDDHTHSNPITYTITEKPSAVREAKRLQQWFPASDFEPVGLYLPAKKKIEVNIEKVKGNSLPVLLVGTYSRHAPHYKPIEHKLKVGKNIIRDNRGGMVYLRYVSSKKPSGEVSANFKGGIKVPIYTLGKTKKKEWREKLNSTKSVDSIFISKRIMLVVSTATAKKYLDRSHDLMLKSLDEICEAEDYISGLDGSGYLHKPNIHKQLITEISSKNNDFMMAANQYRVMIPSASIGHIMNPQTLRTEAWGVWHELGHMRQTLSWCWEEIDEVSVNIYSIAAKNKLKSKFKWLEGHKCWEDINKYMKSPFNKRNYNTDKKLKGKGRLAMFQQLWLKYGDEFYIKLHKQTRKDKAVTKTKEDMMGYFMLASSKASGHNLKKFFRQWGFKLPKKSYDALDALNLPEPDGDLISLRQ